MSSLLSKLNKVSLKDKIFFVQNLRLMLKSGISIDKAINTLSRQVENPRFKEILIDLKQRVEKGQPLSDALKNFPNDFDEIFVNIIKAGESSGKLEEVLNNLFVQLKKRNELISKVKGAMMYPAIVISAMVIIGIGMIVFVIPRLTQMLSQAKAELPLPTKILIGTSNFVTKNSFWIFPLLIIFLGFLYAWSRREEGKKVLHFIILKSPIIGPIAKKVNLATFARTSGLLIQTDIPIRQVLLLTSQTIKNIYYKKILESSVEKIEKGSSLSEILSNYPDYFPPIVTQILEVGEKTGNLSEVLSQLAEFYETEVDNIMKNLPSIIEPILIVVLGMGVAFIALAILTPMFTLTRSMSR